MTLAKYLLAPLLVFGGCVGSGYKAHDTDVITEVPRPVSIASDDDPRKILPTTVESYTRADSDVVNTQIRASNDYGVIGTGTISRQDKEDTHYKSGFVRFPLEHDVDATLGFHALDNQDSGDAFSLYGNLSFEHWKVGGTLVDNSGDQNDFAGLNVLYHGKGKHLDYSLGGLVDVTENELRPGPMGIVHVKDLGGFDASLGAQWQKNQQRYTASITLPQLSDSIEPWADVLYVRNENNSSFLLGNVSLGQGPFNKPINRNGRVFRFFDPNTVYVTSQDFYHGDNHNPIGLPWKALGGPVAAQYVQLQLPNGKRKIRTDGVVFPFQFDSRDSGSLENLFVGTTYDSLINDDHNVGALAGGRMPLGNLTMNVAGNWFDGGELGAVISLSYPIGPKNDN